jgi:NAD+ synthase (glutamine-hydrolysing)
MYKAGFLKVKLITPNIQRGNIKNNISVILNHLSDKNNTSMSLFPELCVSGYECHDLFFNKDFLDEVLEGISYLISHSTYKGLYVIGAPLVINGLVYNCALAIKQGRILAITPKSFLPNTHEFYEKRWFSTLKPKAKCELITILNQEVYFGNVILEDKIHQIKIGIEICEDMWSIYTKGDDYSLKGVNVMLNLSASPERMGKHQIRKEAINSNSRKEVNAYLYCASSSSESTSSVVYGGVKLISTCGVCVKESIPFNQEETLVADLCIDYINYQKRMETNLRSDFNEVRYSYKTVYLSFEESDDYEFEQDFVKTPFLPKSQEDYPFIIDILVNALITKLRNLKDYGQVVIGVSGGLDSTLALLLSVLAYQRMNKDLNTLYAVTMPSEITASSTLSNALELMKELKVNQRTIPINEEVILHQKDIASDKSITKENIQARIRTLILMNLSNELKAIVLGTGDLSEIALGWMTYNGDQASMYAINSGIPKTVVKALVEYLAKTTFSHIKEILLSVVHQPITPELLDNQNTEDIIGKYEINDFILYHFLHYGENEHTIAFLLTKSFKLSQVDAKRYVDNFLVRFFQNQFKRTTLPDGPKVFSFSLSPRGDYRLNNDTWRKK